MQKRRVQSCIYFLPPISMENRDTNTQNRQQQGSQSSSSGSQNMQNRQQQGSQSSERGSDMENNRSERGENK